MTNEERNSHWLKIIESQKASGMTVSAYCRAERIGANYFYKWRRRLFNQEAGGGFIELKTLDAGVRIRLNEKLCIEVERNFDPDVLQAVVETLSRCSA